LGVVLDWRWDGGEGTVFVVEGEEDGIRFRADGFVGAGEEGSICLGLSDFCFQTITRILF
jgi:hypothetical protein